jgi:ASTRA-associated protein 1
MKASCSKYQPSTMSLPPAQPAYIFRGHAAQIHSTTFIRANSRLVTGDADGWIVLWSMATKRAAAVWRAHEGAILASAEWGQDALIT